MGIRKFSEALEKLACFLDALVGVMVAKLWVADGTAKELEVCAFPEDYVGREQRAVDCVVQSRGRDKFAFVGVKVEAELAGGIFELLKSTCDCGRVACETTVVEVGKHKLEPSLLPRRTELY